MINAFQCRAKKWKGYLIFNKNVVYNAYNTKGFSFSSFASLKKNSYVLFIKNSY